MGLDKGWVLFLSPVREKTDAGIINAEVTMIWIIIAEMLQTCYPRFSAIMDTSKIRFFLSISYGLN